VGLCLLVGAANDAVTLVSVRTWYLSLTPPLLTPPDRVFVPVWNVLYLLIGVSAWLVWRRPGHRAPLRMWGWQLLANAFWPSAFFGLRSTLAGLVVIAVLLVLVALTIRRFARVRPLAAWLLAPYLAWTGFAAYLNAGFWWLNRG
jgi:tryptophan-rich sensory protein